MSQDSDKLKKQLDRINSTIEKYRLDDLADNEDLKLTTRKLEELLAKSKLETNRVSKFMLPIYVIFIIFLSALLYQIYNQLFP